VHGVGSLSGHIRKSAAGFPEPVHVSVDAFLTKESVDLQKRQ
jgi:hypothetical protein